MGKQVINAARIVLYRIEESPRPAVKGRGTLAIESACISRHSILAENRLASMTEHGKYELEGSYSEGHQCEKPGTNAAETLKTSQTLSYPYTESG